MRLLFAGTPEAAVPSLRTLLASRHEVVAVLTRPDAAVGRGRRLVRSAVAQVADEAGVPVLQPRTLRDDAAFAAIADTRPDACPIVAYGNLIPPPALAIPRHGWVNLHFSLLPAWRGAAPVQHAVWHGDDLTGATAFRLDEGMDTGPVFGTMTEPIQPDDTAGDLLERLAMSGAALLLATLDALDSGAAVAVPQPADGVSLAPKITVADARIRWSAPALAVHRQVRACTPAPGAWTALRDVRVKVFPVQLVGEPAGPSKGSGTGVEREYVTATGTPGPLGERIAPGRLTQISRNRWVVGTGTGPVELGDVQPAGRQRMPAADWLRGLRPEPGESFT